MAQASQSSSFNISANCSFGGNSSVGVVINEEENENEFRQEEESDVILSVCYKYGKIAAAYYKVNENSLHISNEIGDSKPEFPTLKCLLRELRPFHIATIGSLTDPFIKKLIKFSENKIQLNETLESDEIYTVPNNISLLNLKEFAFHHCEYRFTNLHLASEPEGLTKETHMLHLHSLVNFESKLCVHVLGMLIKFIDKSWTHITNAEHPPIFQQVYRFSLSDIVYVDSSTFEALQIFQNVTHDSRFKHGSSSTGREGFSLFRLFSQHCRNKLGRNKLRSIMSAPSKNMNQLQKRLDFIEFALDHKNFGIVENLRDILRTIQDITTPLNRILHSMGSRNDWQSLYKYIYQTLYFSEVCAAYQKSSEILMDLVKVVSQNLYELEKCIDTTFDFNVNSKNTRPSIKKGLDKILDKHKLTRDSIETNVTTAARIVVETLPDFVDGCNVFYIPDVGYVVGVKKWPGCLDPHELINFGFHYMFEVNEVFHYKNALCKELDRNVGNIQTDILEHENRIIVRVINFVQKFANNIREPMSAIGMIDCLLAMAKVASEKGYKKPVFNKQNIIEIKDGRHPLLELLTAHFVTNDFYSGGEHTRMKIITGPNASGKSIYLKQIGLIIYLAHIGSYLPASHANICMVESMHSRMFSTESCFLSLSAFMIDLRQMAEALSNAKPSSFIVMDEFGRGTTGNEGLALLGGALIEFLRQGNNCPHVLVSSHLQLHSFLQHRQILYQTLDFTRDSDTESIIFLFKVISGVSKSYAIEVAASVGIPPDIIERAKQFYNNGVNALTSEHLLPQSYRGWYNDPDFFNKINIPRFDKR